MIKVINETCKIYIDEGFENLQKCLCEASKINSIEELNKKYDAYFILCDLNTYNLQLHNLMKCLKGNYIYEYIIKPGEGSKTLEEYERIMNYCKEINLSRKSLVIALGGGVVGDLAGFIAATYMRGIDIIQLPTTLLSQVDSSIGGKTGINLGNSKNLIGAFHQPQITYINIESLRTLPEKEFVGGLGEVVKYAFITKNDLLEYIFENYENILTRNPSTMLNVIKRCVKIKSDIVNDDEREGDLRKILNFGHTFGHGIEILCKLNHGDAITIGMHMAFKVALEKELISNTYYQIFLELCNKLNLPITYKYDDYNEIYTIMKNDKKNSFFKINLVIPVGYGEVEIFDNIDEEIILKVIRCCNNDN